jgi:hypothetical protein
MSQHPHFGHTRLGLPVHHRVADHMPDHSAYARFNKRVAVAVTGFVGSMTCAWIFCGLALCSLPAVLSAFGPFGHVFPAWMVKASLIALVAWIAQTFLQLVLLSIIIVGQNIQAAASDARSAKTFEDAEIIADRLNLETKGGLTAVYQEILKAREDFHQVLSALNALHAGQPPGSAGTSRKPGTPKTSSKKVIP